MEAVALAGDRPGEDRLRELGRALDRRRDHGFSLERLLADRARP